MKNLLSVSLLMSILISSLFAEAIKIFDLKDQYFSGTLIEKGSAGYGKEHKYDLPKVIVITDTRFNGVSYMFGLFTVDIKRPLKDWHLNIKEKTGIDYQQSSMIRLVGSNGNNFMVIYGSDDHNNLDYIQINSKKFKLTDDAIRNTKLTLSISCKHGIVVFKINGNIFLKTDTTKFGNLSRIELELNNNRDDDKLLDFELYEIK